MVCAKEEKRIAGLKSLRPAGAYTPHPSLCAPARAHLPKQRLDCTGKESGRTCGEFYGSLAGTQVAGEQSPTPSASNKPSVATTTVHKLRKFKYSVLGGLSCSFWPLLVRPLMSGGGNQRSAGTSSKQPAAENANHCSRCCVRPHSASKACSIPKAN